MYDYNSLIHVCPLLTYEGLNEALTNWFNEEYTFTHWEYTDIGNKGDGYYGDIIGIKMYGTNSSSKESYVRVILKCMPTNISRKLIFRIYEFYKNEINFYQKVLPELLRFQSSKNVKNPFLKYTKLVFAYSDGNDDIICLEDATEKGFKPATVPQQYLDLEHCKFTLKILAEFHALSIAMKDQEPGRFKTLRNTISEVNFNDGHWEWYAAFWKRISGIAIDAIEKEYPDSIYVDKVKQFAVPERYQDLIDAATKTIETGVINHGDAWINNYLYKYEDGHVTDVKVIDFQLVRCATPVLDISFLIYASTSQNLREQHYDELLKHYHDTLSKQIKELGSDPSELYSWELFMEEIKKYSYFGLALSFEAIPFIELTPEDAFNMEFEGDQVLNINDVVTLGNIKTKEGRLREANNVKHCVDRGYI